MDIELKFLDWLQGLHTPIVDGIMLFITRLGNGGFIWIVLAAILLLCSRKRRSGIILAAALMVDLILCNGILKNLFSRIRPFDVNTAIQLLLAAPEDFSFPSGHTAAAFASAAALYFAGEKKLWRPVLVLALLMAFSRLYLYVHYPTDILGGMAVGVLAGYIGYRIVDRLKPSARPDR